MSNIERIFNIDDSKLGIIIIIILSVIIALACYLEYKKNSNIIVKFLVIMFFVALILPFIFLELDRYNFFTTIGWFDNVDPKRWFDFFANYFSTMIGAVISGGVLLLITMHQINESKKQNDEMIKKEARINNSPLLTYRIDRLEKIAQDLDIFEHVLVFDKEEEIPIFSNYILEIRNVGLNTARSVVCIVTGKFKGNSKILTDSNSQIIGKGESIQILFGLTNLAAGDSHQLEFHIIYKDLFANPYSQNIVFNFTVNGYTTNYYNIADEYSINEEIRITIEDYQKLLMPGKTKNE